MPVSTRKNEEIAKKCALSAPNFEPLLFLLCTSSEATTNSAQFKWGAVRIN